jgi:cytochrome c biogenesis protein CcmG/thiol:disulfide interchange protein DsbE
MRNRIFLAVGVLFLAGCRVGDGHVHGAAADMIGHPFPSFAFASVPGRDSVRSRDLAGSTSLVVFWATWCEPCREEVGELKQLMRNDPSLNVVGLSVDDSPAAVPLMVNRLSIPYPVGVGANIFYDQLKLEEIPQSFLLDANGIVRDAFIGVVSDGALHQAVEKARQPL